MYSRKFRDLKVNIFVVDYRARGHGQSFFLKNK